MISIDNLSVGSVEEIIKHNLEGAKGSMTKTEMFADSYVRYLKVRYFKVPGVGTGIGIVLILEL